ncbi:MAG: hypothetical protein F6K34_10385, partial [Okeania sp. SIO4D6]|nr:hypothetical protein [Okeania sp. SIO4D6]
CAKQDILEEVQPKSWFLSRSSSVPAYWQEKRIVASLGAKKCLILRNHGLLTVGRTIAEAFYYMYYLNQACDIQVNVLGTGTKPIIPPPEICEHTARQFEEPTFHNQEVARVWEANRRLLDRLDPSYRD